MAAAESLVPERSELTSSLCFGHGRNALKKASPAKGVRQRDPDATKMRILDAAKREFARLGFGGARVDSIAIRAKANKRMIYHYFSSKEELFTAVLEEAYSESGRRSANWRSTLWSPKSALDALVEFTWKYYLANPEFLTFVNSENLHKARHLKKSAIINEEYPGFVEIVQGIIDRGVAKGIFRPDIDAVQLNITMRRLIIII